MTPKIFSAALWILIALALATCFFAGRLIQPSSKSSAGSSPTTMWVQESGSTMGANYRLHFINPFDLKSKRELVELIRSQRNFLIEIENLISTWKPDSQLSQFNRQTTTDWLPVSLHTVEMIELANEISAIDKRFDVTLEPLSNLWGFRPAERRTSAPTTDEINECLKHIGSDKLQCRRDPPALRKTDPLVHVDLSALAAGYVADKLAQQLTSLGVNDFYIDVAGEIVTHGRNREGQKWRVGIAEPVVGSSRIYSTLSVTDCGMATSGNYRNFIQLEGTTLGHILDPTTGRPTNTDVLSATVMHPSCARADAIATLLMTMSGKEGLKLANQQAWQVLLLVKKEDGNIGEVRSNAFQPSER